MKKTITLFLLLVCAMGANAQNFFSDVTYNIVGAVGVSSANSPFSGQRFSIRAGVDAAKPFKMLLDNKMVLYGQAGMHYLRKGAGEGEFYDWEPEYIVGHVEVPIHAGVRYNFNDHFGLFADLGPDFSLKISEEEANGVETKGFEMGIGFQMGIILNKKFSFLFGFEKSLTNTATVLGDDKEGLKSQVIYAALRWTIGKNRW